MLRNQLMHQIEMYDESLYEWFQQDRAPASHDMAVRDWVDDNFPN